MESLNIMSLNVIAKSPVISGTLLFQVEVASHI